MLLALRARLSVSTGLAACSLLFHAAAQAADAPPAPASNEAIIVTGERIARPLQRTPSSVTVFTGDMIATTPGADRLDALFDLTPNVTLGTQSLGPTIRGQDSTGALQDLPAFLGGNRSRVTLQVDGRPVGYNEFVFSAAPLWDVAQVEIFRSPQSTTQGRNAIAGAIFVTTRDPVFAWEGAARAAIGSRDARQLSAMVSGPLVADQLAFRVAADWRRERTASRITDVMPGADPNLDTFSLVRAKLLAEPRALPGFKLRLTYAHSESSAPQVERVSAPFRKRRDPSPGYGVFKTRVDSLTAVADQSLAETIEVRTTASLGWARADRYPRPGVGRAENASRDLSLEGLVRWSPAPSVRLTGGVHHIRTRLDQKIDLSAVLGIGKFDDSQRSLGIFGEATVTPLPRLTLTAGLRRQRDTQHRQGLLASDFNPLPLDFDGTYAAWLPKVSLAYDFADGVTAGLLVQRAYNPGGVTLNFDTAEQEVFGAETLWAYEAFARARLAGGRIGIAANLFYNRIRGAQRANFFAYRVPGGATAFWARIDNVPRAETWGLEASADWRVTPRLQVRGGIGLLGSKIVEPSAGLPQLDGNAFARAPKFTASGALDWRPRDGLRLSLTARHSAGYYSDDANSALRKVGRSNRIDARAAWALGAFELSAYVRNLLDDFEMTYLFSSASGVAMDPREIGIGLEARF